jgi:hypothetical protein
MYISAEYASHHQGLNETDDGIVAEIYIVSCVFVLE